MGARRTEPYELGGLNSSLNLRRDLDAHVGGLYDGVDDDAGRELKFVGRFSRDQRDKSVWAGLYLNLCDDGVLDDVGHEPDETVACRLRSRRGGLQLARERGREFGECLTLKGSSPVSADRGGDPTRRRPAAKRVNADAQ